MSKELQQLEKINGITDTMIRRQIKFRFWTGTMMEPWDHAFTWESLGYYLACNERIPMQFTGLLDKNGKEIWEGDIVLASWMYHGKPGTPFKAIIFYNQHIGSFRIGYDGMSGGAQDEIYFRYQIEVLGNIYENPELFTRPKTQPR